MAKWLDSLKKALTIQQLVFLMIFVALLSVIPIFYQVWEEFSRYRRLENPHYDHTKWSDYYIVAYLTPLVFVGQLLTSKLLKGYFYGKFKGRFEGEALHLKVHKATKNLFKGGYYIWMVIFGFYVFSDTEYQSSMMFGSGKMEYLYSNWPYNPTPRCLKFYYMAGISYHTSDMIHLLIKPAQSDFFEMLLHHYITIMLIVGSYMTNFWNHGIKVMIQMDTGEVLIGVLRWFNDIWPTWILIPLFMLLNFFWIYFRIVVYTIEVVIFGTLRARAKLDLNESYQTVIQTLLVILLALNCYWQILFFRMAYRLIWKGDTKDIQNPVEDLQKRDKAHKEKIKQN